MRLYLVSYTLNILFSVVGLDGRQWISVANCCFSILTKMYTILATKEVMEKMWLQL